MKKVYSFLLYILGLTTFAQNSNNEQFPLFHDCEGVVGKQQESCFYNTIQNYFYFDENRPYDNGVSIAQGNKTTVMIADL